VREFADARITFVVSHGDFSPANLFLDAQRTVGFDFKANSARPPARDILHFLVYARSFNTSTWTLLTSQVGQRDLDAFLSAYGPLDGAMDERLLTVFRLAETLYSWAHLLDRMHREGQSVRRMARALRLRSMAGHAARSLRRD
jgi:Ser/Thr protein kinase RdoA (MazF antagonist)